MSLHDDLIVIDGAQYSNWDRGLWEELQAGGLTAVSVTIVYWEDTRQTLVRIGEMLQQFRLHGDLIMPAKSGADIRIAKEQGKVAIILAAQNASPIENDIRLVAVMRELGLMVMQLTYNNYSLLGAGCYEGEDAGITRFGREVIAEMNRVGMVIDMSHSAERTTLDAIAISDRPITISHANPTFWYDGSVRNKSSNVLKAMADKGGLLGFSLYPLHLKGGADCTLTEFCQMVADTADLMGVDNIGIGSDMCRGWGYGVLEWMRSGTWTLGVNYGEGVVGKKSWPQLPAWFNTPADMPNLTEGLLKHGFSNEEVGKIMGGNWLRFMEDGFMPR